MDTEVTDPLCSLLLEQIRPPTARSWTLDHDRVTIGRDPLSDVMVEDPNVSRHHADLIRHGLTWAIVDEASTNGTFVNGARVQQMALQPGDHISVGSAELVLTQIGATTAAPSPPAPVPAPIRYDVGSQVGNINNVAGNQSTFNQANYYRENSLRYIANRRGRARLLVVWGVVLFFVGQGISMFAVLSVQNSLFNSINSTSFEQPEVSPTFIPLFGAGMFLTLAGLAMFIFGLITRSGAKREALKWGAQW